AYVRGGACAISVLTEPDYFLGSLEHLSAVAAAVSVPVMRKDFLVSPAQVFEARLHGASGVLVVLRCTPDPGALIDAAAEAGMFVLVEAFDAHDLDLLDTLLPLQDHVLVGVNARDLDTLGIDHARHGLLRSRLPVGLRSVAESGIRTVEDAARAATLGYELALVGSALMAHDDPTALLSRLQAAADAVWMP
ncbi:MAG: indole-3-glycerol phosphate synthase, partial [Kiritimatiellia bacterium]